MEISKFITNPCYLNASLIEFGCSCQLFSVVDIRIVVLSESKFQLFQLFTAEGRSVSSTGRRGVCSCSSTSTPGILRCPWIFPWTILNFCIQWSNIVNSLWIDFFVILKDVPHWKSFINKVSLVTSNFLLTARVTSSLDNSEMYRFTSFEWCSLKSKELRDSMLPNNGPGTKKTESFAT